jgi:uncharacterized protein YcfJ
MRLFDPRIVEWCTKTSDPSGWDKKPKPRAVSKNLTVPVKSPEAVGRCGSMLGAAAGRRALVGDLVGDLVGRRAAGALAGRRAAT